MVMFLSCLVFCLAIFFYMEYFILYDWDKMNLIDHGITLTVSVF